MQGTPFLCGKHSWPFASVDKWGNVAIVKYAVNPHMVERIGKMLAVAAYGSTTIAGTPLPAVEMKEILVRGTLTTMRRALEDGRDPLDAAIEATGGWRLFEGVVTGKDWEDREGYMFGTTHIRGTGDYEGQTLDVWFKNENHITWLNGEPWRTEFGLNEAAGPRYYGFDIDYVPIEELMARSG